MIKCSRGWRGPEAIENGTKQNWRIAFQTRKDENVQKINILIWLVLCGPRTTRRGKIISKTLLLHLSSFFSLHQTHKGEKCLNANRSIVQWTNFCAFESPKRFERQKRTAGSYKLKSEAFKMPFAIIASRNCCQSEIYKNISNNKKNCAI